MSQANPPYQDRVEDLCQMSFLNESSMVHTISQRFGSNLIYTYAGPHCLLAVNPMQSLNIFSDMFVIFELLN
ncbi:unnamed protein product [Protopolystoma xenopodis]|uniref:Myosin motor domain-containing protein n=1 Tax=Protopolystoma xenopodis TaxID=117903 RepID=A0A448WPD9_9PLAT|nr:unnamed protein product [Protopolystoma xenopodis]